MRIDRRSVLQGAGALGLGLALPGTLGAQGATPRGLVLIVDRIGPDVPEDALRALLEPLGQSMIPVALTLLPEAGAGLAALAGRAAAEMPDLFELVLRVDGLAGMTPYFQMRAAAQARAAVETALMAAGMDANDLPPMVTAVTDRDGPLVRMDAIRAAGLRNVLALAPGAGWARSVPCDGGALCLSGGIALRPGAAAGPLGDWLDRRDGTGDLLLAVLSAPDLAGQDITAIRTDADAMAARIVQAVQGDAAFVVAPREHLAWFSDTQARSVALRLVLPPAGDDSAGLDALRAALETAGWPLSISGPPGAGTPADADLCPVVTDAAALADWVAARVAPCAAGDPGPEGPAVLAQAGLGVLVGPQGPGLPAVDAHGLIHRPELTDPADLARAPRGGDVILALGPATYADAAARTRVLEALRPLAEDPATRRQSVTALAADLIPADPVFALLRLARAHRHRAPPPLPLDPGALRADAAHAWAYVAAYTDPATGLCPATVHHTDGQAHAYRTLTMWDMGSLIRGTMAAHELGLVPDGEFADRAAALVAALPASRIGGAVLPNELIASDRIATLSDDFNICDTGRLLAALRDLDRHPLTPGIAAPLVARWDLARVVPDGWPRSIAKGRAVDSFGSHCTHYTAQALRGWGVPMRSPYDALGAGTDTDWQMRVLETASGIGAYGAEPLLLEAIETGLSAPSAVLADVLHAAQAEARAATGALVCVSESPLDRAPWFAYAGLRLNDGADRWDVRANTNDPAHQTEAFRRANLVVNTKAAFLWAALRPDALAQDLLDHVRSRARVDEGGFSPGVYAETGLGMPGYADLNTNGVILDAVAFALRGGRPRGAPG